ncbi:hypothetical protein [Knoellia locipacati]|uniref:hypothetical protein n=1 Tax=Knoellia locipacati TaxID=882824 RepID=UPI00164B3F94|nr:hypothetical protein [Knoellia locipacati]
MADVFWVIAGIVLLVVLAAAWLWDRGHTSGFTPRDRQDMDRAQRDAVADWFNAGGTRP